MRMIDRSKNSGMPKRFFTKLSITGSFARHSGSSVSHPACRSSSTTSASPWIVARANGSAGTPTGSVSATATFGFALMWRSFFEKSTADVMKMYRPS